MKWTKPRAFNYQIAFLSRVTTGPIHPCWFDLTLVVEAKSVCWQKHSLCSSLSRNYCSTFYHSTVTTVGATLLLSHRQSDYPPMHGTLTFQCLQERDRNVYKAHLSCYQYLVLTHQLLVTRANLDICAHTISNVRKSKQDIFQVVASYSRSVDSAARRCLCLDVKSRAIPDVWYQRNTWKHFICSILYLR